jgi:nucleoid DNA-binding protein
MNRGDIIEALHAGTQGEITYRDASHVLDVIFKTIKKGLVAGQDVKLQGFGTFRVVQHAVRGRNIVTGESHRARLIRIIKFKAADEMRIVLNR